MAELYKVCLKNLSLTERASIFIPEEIISDLSLAIQRKKSIREKA